MNNAGSSRGSIVHLSRPTRSSWPPNEHGTTSIAINLEHTVEPFVDIHGDVNLDFPSRVISVEIKSKVLIGGTMDSNIVTVNDANVNNGASMGNGSQC